MNKNRHNEMINEARGTAERARQEFGLDYSLESLRRVDALLGELGDCGDDLAGRAAYMMGCYVGEVLVRQTGVEWVVEEEMKEMFGSPIFLQAGDIQVSPITRCYRRLKSDSDGVEVWGRITLALASGNFPAEVTERTSDEKIDWQSQGF